MQTEANHLHLHTLVEYGGGVPGPRRDQRSTITRLETGRGQHVETSLLQAALGLTAIGWQRAEHNDAPGYRTWIFDSRAPKGFFRCSDGRWVDNWVPNPHFVLSSAEGETLELRHDAVGVRDDPRRIPPDPENIVVLAHYHEQIRDASRGSRAKRGSTWLVKRACLCSTCARRRRLSLTPSSAKELSSTFDARVWDLAAGRPRIRTEPHPRRGKTDRTTRG